MDNYLPSLFMEETTGLTFSFLNMLKKVRIHLKNYERYIFQICNYIYFYKTVIHYLSEINDQIQEIQQ